MRPNGLAQVWGGAVPASYRAEAEADGLAPARGPSGSEVGIQLTDWKADGKGGGRGGKAAPTYTRKTGTGLTACGRLLRPGGVF